MSRMTSPVLVFLVALVFTLSGLACKSQPKGAPAQSPASADVSTATSTASTILVRGKGAAPARLERRGDGWLLSADDLESIACQPHDPNKGRCRTVAGADVAEIKTHFEVGNAREGSMKMIAPDGRLLWKVHFSPEKIKVSDNEENREAWILSLKHADRIQVVDPSERAAGTVRRKSDRTTVQNPDGNELFTVEGAGSLSAAALLLVSVLPSRDRLMLMAELITRGL